MAGLSFLREGRGRSPRQQAGSAEIDAPGGWPDPGVGAALRRARNHQRALLVARQQTSRFRQLRADRAVAPSIPRFLGGYPPHSFSTFARVTGSIWISGGQGRLKPSPGSFRVASIPSLVPIAISLVA